MDNISWKRVGLAVAVGGTASLVGAPVVVSALGFKAGGIVAKSVAANMMSSAAIANGGGIVVGSTVSVLQSVGVLGFSMKSSAIIAGVAGGGSALLTGVTKDSNNEVIVGDSVVCGTSSKSFTDGASYIMTNATPILQSVGGALGFYKPVLTIEALVSQEDITGETKWKSILDGSKYVMGGASDIMASATSTKPGKCKSSVE
ncbi:uncharacterized protein LOC123540579 [Mercenaria mercenaria]|uniref:uncharacterized protein LOC123540579 n=1 Tax=Mercenaria mercenaria TaxID=6596 RepID=UPI00234F7111|nr:uncharacterized protein LOC123540579 [Mercenaria mercenaria]